MQGVIDEFLNRYSNDPRAAPLREYDKELDLRRLEWKFDHRISGKPRSDGLLPSSGCIWMRSIRFLSIRPLP